ncbi:hypothetical protein A3C73_03480 [Candidatus Giovannonibacteria bacterium RIFCSPHIGHO2_02_FULL_44_11]|nr:MAG: hypothetical protein A3C73_03480 [Candidatus Giovannonibacteria bacterium RIFCSPHIGHO2_02_FULL_44_11]
MITRLGKFFNRDLSNIHHAAFWLAMFGILADILALLRDRLLAGMFGASRTLDIYYAAFRVPDFIYTIMLLFTASTAIIPIFLEKYAERKDSAAAEAFLGSLISFFTILIVVIAAAAFFLMPFLMPLFLPGFSSDDMQSAVLLGRILLLSPVFLGLSNIISSATQSFNRFFVYGLSGVFYNIGIIIGIAVFYKWWGLAGLVWGVALGAFLHMAIQLPSLSSVGIRPKFSMRWDKDIKHIARLSLPRTLGLGISQITLTALTAMASVLASGSIAVFNLALNLQSIPITIIGLSYSVAAFPALASFSLKKARSRFEEHFNAAFLHILFWALPFSVLLLVLRAQVVRIILGSGNFSWPDTKLTAASLFILSLAVVFQSLFYLLVRAFYADGESWRPLIINLISALLSLGSAFWFVGALAQGGFLHAFSGSLFRLADVEDIRVLALSLGMLAGAAINFIFLSFTFRIIFGWFPAKGSLKSILEISAAAVFGGIGAYWGLNVFAYVFNLRTFFGIFCQGFFAGILGILINVGVLWILKNRQLQEIHKSLMAGFEEPPKDIHQVAAPEPEKLP